MTVRFLFFFKKATLMVKTSKSKRYKTCAEHEAGIHKLELLRRNLRTGVHTTQSEDTTKKTRKIKRDEKEHN